MFVLILIFLVILGVGFLKFLGFLCGSVCTLMGAAGFITFTYIKFSGGVLEDEALLLTLSIFSLLLGIFLLWLTFKKKKAEENKKSQPEIHFSPEFEEWLKTKYNNTEQEVQ